MKSHDLGEGDSRRVNKAIRVLIEYLLKEPTIQQTANKGVADEESLAKQESSQKQHVQL